MSSTPNNKSTQRLQRTLTKLQDALYDASSENLNSGAYLKACNLTHTMHKCLARMITVTPAPSGIDDDMDMDACFVMSTSEGMSRLMRLSDLGEGLWGEKWWLKMLLTEYMDGVQGQSRVAFATPEEFIQETYGDGTNQCWSLPFDHSLLTMEIEDDEELWKFAGVLPQSIDQWLYDNGSNHMDIIGPKMYRKLVEMARELDEDWFDAIKPMAANDPEVFMQPPIMQITFGWI